MRIRHGVILTLGAMIIVGLSPAVPAAGLLVQLPSAPQSTQPPDPIEQLLDQLGDDQYTRREEATRKLFSYGAEIVPRLRARLGRETDPEIQHRLRHILDNILPPRQAVLLVRAAPATGLEPGIVITHAGSRRVRNRLELRQQMASPRPTLLRVRGSSGPQECGPVEARQLHELADYVAPRGEVLARAVRLYATGFAEEAGQALAGLPEPIPENEMSKQLRARIAYTAGDRAAALKLLADHTDSVSASGARDWSSPSYLDLCGPGKAPFHLEWVLATRAGSDAYATRADPDLRIQRILLPAGRFADAFQHTVGYWWEQYRPALGSNEGTDHVAGNQLAVAAWMLHGMDLRSECCRLIQPRSAILHRLTPNARTWIRVETDAWLPFLAGDARSALDGFFEDALDVLQHPPRPNDPSVLIRNPRVAARVAFFLYQFPDDPRVEKELLAVSHHTHPALTDYLDWMLYALNEKTHHAIRRDLQATLPQLPDEKVLPYARAVALLEYVQNKPDHEVLRTARRRVLNASAGQPRELWLAIVDALLHLSAERPDEARRALLPFRARSEASALWHTAAFLSAPPASAANHQALRRPLLAVPMGSAQGHWLVLARDRRLLHFDTAAGLLTLFKKPTPTWFPNPLTWPWVGREDRSGRVWVYCRRRLIEIDPTASDSGLRLNLRTGDIPAFHRCVGPRFSQFANAVALVALQPGENSEYLRAEIKANGEYCADPDLPELGMIQALRQDPRVVHAALRGGPHLLIDTASERSWTSLWIQEQLDLPTPPEFFAQALWADDPEAAPVVFLMSDQGLIRFDLGPERLTRIPLPGPDPHPALVPESAPYERRDPRWVYCARLPQDGGQVFRVTLADGTAGKVDMINEALPPNYYDTRPRAEIRATLSRRLKDRQLPDLESLVADAAETVERWTQEQGQEP